jgi:ABC-type Mn2+/Zn2+ transport system permease subunit
MLDALADPFFRNALFTAGALSIACAVLSVFVVSRRWAFIGEGISHSGFGGAGTVWLLALLFPGWPVLHEMGAAYAGVVVFCLATAVGIGWLSRQGRVNSDAAIGVFLVASLAWGFLAWQIYRHVNRVDPVGFETILFGHMRELSNEYAVAAVMVSAAVLLTVAALNKEIVYFCFDPGMAQASGVRSGFIHYLLMILIAMTIIVGVRVAGSVLVTALLILPGTTAMLLSNRLRDVLMIAVVIGIIGALGGVLAHQIWRHVPTGPAIVLTLFGTFILAYMVSKARAPVGRLSPE